MGVCAWVMGLACSNACAPQTCRLLAVWRALPASSLLLLVLLSPCLLPLLLHPRPAQPHHHQPHHHQDPLQHALADEVRLPPGQQVVPPEAVGHHLDFAGAVNDPAGARVVGGEGGRAMVGRRRSPASSSAGDDAAHDGKNTAWGPATHLAFFCTLLLHSMVQAARLRAGRACLLVACVCVSGWVGGVGSAGVNDCAHMRGGGIWKGALIACVCKHTHARAHACVLAGGACGTRALPTTLRWQQPVACVHAHCTNTQGRRHCCAVDMLGVSRGEDARGVRDAHSPSGTTP